MEHIAEVYIQANDDANGILQLSASSVSVSEDSMTPFLNVTRVAGSFGTVSQYCLELALQSYCAFTFCSTEARFILPAGDI